MNLKSTVKKIFNYRFTVPVLILIVVCVLAVVGTTWKGTDTGVMEKNIDVGVTHSGWRDNWEHWSYSFNYEVQVVRASVIDHVTGKFKEKYDDDAERQFATYPLKDDRQFIGVFMRVSGDSYLESLNTFLVTDSGNRIRASGLDRPKGFFSEKELYIDGFIEMTDLTSDPIGSARKVFVAFEADESVIEDGPYTLKYDYIDDPIFEIRDITLSASK